MGRPAKSGRKAVFGLSITETVEWGYAFAEDGRIVGDIERGVFEEIPDGNLPHRPNETYDIERAIRAALQGLKTAKPYIFSEASGIGVSTIGVVDRAALTLDNISRKNWAKKRSDHLIDFKSLFLPQPDGGWLFDRIDEEKNIVLQNDASARCVAEYVYGNEVGADLESILYVMIGEGINGAIAYRTNLPTMLRHSEMGHILPQLHAADEGFNFAYSGCPAHGTCFEGVMSTGRFRQQWGKPLVELPSDHIGWSVIADYITQLVIVGVHTLNPSRVLLGGDVFAGKRGLALVDFVRAEFEKRNKGYLPDYTEEEAIANLIRRADFGESVTVLSALTMACVAAFPRGATIHDISQRVRLVQSERPAPQTES